MAVVWIVLCPLFLLFNFTFCLDVNQIEVPTDDGISGVLLIQTKDKKYSFNATTAKDACNAIKMRIATKAEMEAANTNGLQTCRFGWIEEQIAVIPRTEKNPNCGQNSLGISVWRADISRKFDVYCFKPTGPDVQVETTTSRSFKPTTEDGRTTSTSHSSTKSTRPSTIHSAVSAVTSLLPHSSTPSISFPFNISSKTFITISLSSTGESSQATTSPQLRSSPRTLTTFLTSSTSSSSHSSTNTVHQHISHTTEQPKLSQTATPNRSSIKAASKTIVIVSVMLLLLMTAAGTAWYLKIKRGQRFPSWTRMRPKHFIETEMWRHIRERHCVQDQMRKDNNNRKCDNIILQMEDPDTDLPED